MDKVFIFMLCCYFCSAKIKINRLDVPSAIQYGSQDDVILDCDFDSGGDPVEEIKWFLDGDNQIYQWLPLTKTNARALGKLRNHIDVNYKATNDANTMYRALHIKDLLPEFSGNYTCKVSGPMSEDVETKRMIIYVTPNDDTDDDDGDNDILDLIDIPETSQIICSAGGFYPEPNMTLYIIDVNDNETEIILREDHEMITETEEGYYNVSSILEYDTANFTENFIFICELNLPGTPYNISETAVHIHEDSSELRVEEDFLNSTSSTESSIEESTVIHLEIETQIEEESDNISTTTEPTTNIDAEVTKEETKNLKESASLRHLPSLLSTMFIMGLVYL